MLAPRSPWIRPWLSRRDSLVVSLAVYALLAAVPPVAWPQAGTENQVSFPSALGEPRSVRVAPALGAASDSIPIIVSPGRRNVEPHLTLAYSSLGVPGDAGLGWQLDIGYVERWRGDGTPTVGEPDTYSFSLAGLGGELHDTGGGLYRARIESAYREFRRNAVHGGWEMTSGEGVLHRFGGTPESRIDGQLWMLDRAEDASGNTIHYLYDKVQGALYLREIRYTGYAPSGDLGANRVLLDYQVRPDAHISYSYGLREERTLRLSRISVFAGESLARRYELQYQQSAVNGQSLLTRIILVGADDTSRLTLRTLEYSTRSLSPWQIGSGIIPLDFADGDGRDTGARLSDVNGDGFADILGNGQDVYLGNGSGHFTRDAPWSTSLAAASVRFVDGDGGDTGVRLVDVNADARPDLLIASPARREVWLNTGMGWSATVPEARQWTASLATLAQQASAFAATFYLGTPTDCRPPPCDGPLGAFPGCSAPLCEGSDEDSDDCIPPEDALPLCPASVVCTQASALCAAVQEPFSLIDAQADSKGVQLADVNGDGRLDILWSMVRTESLFWLVSRTPVFVWGVFLNTGTGWQRDDGLTAALGSLPAPFVQDSELQGYDVMDVNGDGLADILRTWSSAAREVYLGTGGGWTRDDAYSASLQASAIVSLDGARKGQGLMPVDFDDDGLVDYLRAREGADALAYHNTGSGWQASPDLAAWLTRRGVAFVTADGAGTGVVLGDLDGDGIFDFVQAKSGLRQHRLSGALRAGLLTQATSVLGEVTTLTWGSATRFDNRRADGVAGLPSPMPVVTALTRRDGRGHAYTTVFEYQGGVYEDRQLRGFARSWETRPAGLTVVTRYHQEEGLAGQLDVEEGFDRAGALRTRRSSVYERVAAAPRVEQIRLVQIDTEARDSDGARRTRTVNTFDERLSYLSVWRDPDRDVAGDETTSAFSWARNAAAGIWSLPVRTRVTGADGSVLSESIVLYDGRIVEGEVDRGLPSEVRDLAQAGSYLSKRMDYDQYGNVTRVQDRAGGVTEFLYGDATSTFRTQATDPVGRVVRSAYDPRFGELIRDEDASGNLKRNEYDAFGRLLRVTLPGDEASPLATRTYTYSDVGDAQAQFFRVAQTETPGGADTLETTTWFDGMGLIYRVAREGPAGTPVVTLTELDDAGNPVQTSRPFFEGEAARMSVIERDELHRPVRVVEPDGLPLAVTYAGPRADLIDRRGSLTSFYRNGDGKIAAVHQWIDGAEQVTRYGYDGLGRLTSVVDALGAETHIAYDALGRRTRLDDPNAGTYRYRYDGEDRLIEQIAPDGQRTAFTYNLAGDLLRKEFPDGSATLFTYGEPGTGNAVGRVVRIDDAAGVVELHYDGRGNVIERRRTLLGRLVDTRTTPADRRHPVLERTYVTGYVYDSLDRVRRITYPDGFTAFYEYDAGGNIARVLDGAGREVAGGMEYNAAGQLLRIGFGNGAYSEFAYDDLLRMRAIDTASGPGGVLQGVDYDYDPGGNVLSMTDRAFGRSQVFAYDEIGRLTRAIGPYGEERYDYDAIGNLLRKGELAFAMDPAHPQRAICALRLKRPGQRNMGEPWPYDNHPNVQACMDGVLAAGQALPEQRRAVRDEGRRAGANVLPREFQQGYDAFHLAYDGRGNVVEKGGRRFRYDAENHLIEVRDAGGALLEENLYDAGGQRVIQRTPWGNTYFIDGIYEEGRTHALKHVRAGPLLVATVATPRGEVRLIQEVPAVAYSSPGTALEGFARLWGSLPIALFGLVGLGLTLVAPLGGGRCLLAGLTSVGDALRRRPWTGSVALTVVASHLLVSSGVAWGGIGAPLPSGERYSQESRYYYHANHLGSVDVVTDETGGVVARHEYRPYGEPAWRDPTLSSGPDRGPRDLLLTFNGQRYDYTAGVYDFGARHYDPELGRFLSADTQVPDPMNPKSLNRYAYAGDNPIRYVDPTGHSFWDILLGIFVVIAVIVVGVFTAGAGLALFGTLGGALLLTLGLGLVGAGAFAAVALARGVSPLSQDFWVAFGTGFILGAVIGAGIAALPAALSVGSGLLANLASLGANMLVGAMFGALETTIAHFVSGGGPEALLGDLLISVGISAAVAALTFGLFKGLGKLTTSTSKLARFLKEGLKLTWGVSRSVHAGFTGKTALASLWSRAEQFLGATLLSLLYFSGSPTRAVGIPAYGFAGTWLAGMGGEGTPAEAAFLQTMPLAP